MRQGKREREMGKKVRQGKRRERDRGEEGESERKVKVSYNIELQMK